LVRPPCQGGEGGETGPGAGRENGWAYAAPAPYTIPVGPG
jgi:hypothetical protein